jgi:hypothetical protein
MRLISIATILVILQSTPLLAQRFRHDDPVVLDNDDAIDVKGAARRRLSDYYDFLENTFLKAGERSNVPALNGNTVGGVADSSWFTNRKTRGLMPTGTGPATGAPWQVVEGKSEGVTPGFRIRDSRGDVYVIKFDPLTNPEMATAAEIISTHLFHAIGYNVPENVLVSFTRDQLVIGANAVVRDSFGKERRLTARDLDQILAKVPQQEGGRYRAVASKFLSGKPLGPFKYYGTRADDPNDVFPHEHRRELRGLAVFAAWLNHDDSRAINSLDMLVSNDGRHYVKHYLIDFGSTLGSGSVSAQKPRAGNEYVFEMKPTLSRIATLGLWDRPWIRTSYPELPSIGRLESAAFDPAEWKPEYPNAAFKNLQPEDGYWSAKIVMSFSNDDIRRAVKAGQLTDKRAEEYLIDALIERRDKIGRYWFSKVVSLDNFRIEGNSLRFDYLLSQLDLDSGAGSGTALWYRFDNATDQKTAIGCDDSRFTGYTISLPPEVLSGDATTDSIFVVDIAERMSVFVRNRQGNLQIIGIERN